MDLLSLEESLWLYSQSEGVDIPEVGGRYDLSIKLVEMNRARIIRGIYGGGE